MGRKRVGGFVFEWYIGDHPPLHVHVIKDSRDIGSWDIENQRPMHGLNITPQLRRALEKAGFVRRK